MAQINADICCPIEDFEMAYPAGAEEVCQNRVVVYSSEVVQREQFDDHYILHTKNGGLYKVPHCWSGNLPMGGVVSSQIVLEISRFDGYDLLHTNQGNTYKLSHAQA